MLIVTSSSGQVSVSAKLYDFIHFLWLNEAPVGELQWESSNAAWEMMAHSKLAQNLHFHGQLDQRTVFSFIHFVRKKHLHLAILFCRICCGIFLNKKVYHFSTSLRIHFIGVNIFAVNCGMMMARLKGWKLELELLRVARQVAEVPLVLITGGI